jgi:curved DNA-binding protein CbpA
MKPFREQTHYEILEVAPNVLPLEIRHAYKRAVALYEDSAIASYSFFSERERREILACIEEAYLTLIDADARAAYDQRLREQGILGPPEPEGEKDKQPVALYAFQRLSGYDLPPDRRYPLLKSLAAKNPAVQERLAQETLSGSDLEAIRSALQMPLEEISRQTNIRIEILQAVEVGDREHLPPRVYLKGFLKAYARCLALEEERVAAAYLRWLEQGTASGTPQG